jgi:cytidylate kinase
MRIEPDGRLIDQRVTEWRLLEKARKARDPASPARGHGTGAIVTISRQYGAGGLTVAKLVAPQLGPDWSVWDTELIDAVAKRAAVRKEIVESLDEKPQGWARQLVQNVVGGAPLDTQSYRHYLGPVLIGVAHQGKKIIVGRGANFILQRALNVRLEAMPDFRVHETMRRLDLTHDQARELTKRSDRERAEFCQSAFGRDINDTKAYHMVLQTDKLGYETCAAVIVTAARAMFGSDAGG